MCHPSSIGTLFFSTPDTCSSQLLVDFSFRKFTIPISIPFPASLVQQGVSIVDRAVAIAAWGLRRINYSLGLAQNGQERRIGK